MNCCNVFHYAYIPGNTQHSSLLKASKVRLVTCKQEATFVTILSIKAFYFILLKLQCTFRIKKKPVSCFKCFALCMQLFLNTNDVWRVAPEEKDLRYSWGTCCTSSSMERRNVYCHRPWLLHSISLHTSSSAWERKTFLDIAWTYPKRKRCHTVTESSYSVDPVKNTQTMRYRLHSLKRKLKCKLLFESYVL